MKISGDAIGAVLCETLYCRLRLRFAEVRQRVERALVMKYGVVRALRLNAYFADVAPAVRAVFERFRVNDLIAQRHALFVKGQQAFPKHRTRGSDEHAQAAAVFEGTALGVCVNGMERAIGAGKTPYVPGGET